MKSILITLLLLGISVASWAQDDVFQYRLKDFSIVGKVKTVWELEYTVSANKKGDLKKEKLLSKSLYTFSENGFATKGVNYNVKTGKKDFEMDYVYQGGKRPTSVVVSSGIRMVPTYDEKGFLKELQVSEAHRNLPYKFVFENDANGNPVRTNIFVGKMLSNYIEGKFDADGNITEKKTYNSGKKLIDTTLYTYDEHHNLIKEEFSTEKESDHKVFLYEYTYEYRNNWVKRIKYIPNDDDTKKPVSVIERNLEYFQ